MSASGPGASLELSSLAEVAAGVAACRRCPLGASATRAMSGTGERAASLMLVLESPSHEEDLSGQALAGPSGRLLAEALVRAQISARDIYVTHAVKHFAWRSLGARRQARRPMQGELTACAPYLAAEVRLVAPQVLVACGASALRSVLGRTVSLAAARGHVFDTALAPTVVSHHPASIVRLSATARARALAELTHDLEGARRLAEQLSTGALGGASVP